jgi:hypothetical protein
MFLIATEIKPVRGTCRLSAIPMKLAIAVDRHRPVPLRVNLALVSPRSPMTAVRRLIGGLVWQTSCAATMGVWPARWPAAWKCSGQGGPIAGPG